MIFFHDFELMIRALGHMVIFFVNISNICAINDNFTVFIFRYFLSHPTTILCSITEIVSKHDKFDCCLLLFSPHVDDVS